MLERLLDATARTGLWLPVALASYFFVRIAGLPPTMWLPLLALGAAVAWLGARKAAPREAQVPPALGGLGIQPVLALGLLCAVLTPHLAIAMRLGFGQDPPGFLDADDAYNLMIARGLHSAWPPVDLSYAGRVLNYHPGGPLLLDLVLRLSGLPAHTVLYAALPLLLKLFAVAALHRIFSRLLGAARGAWRPLAAACCTVGVFWIDPFNVAWNLRNIVLGHGFSGQTVFTGVPVGTFLAGALSGKASYGSDLAEVLLLLLVANLDRARPLSMALALVTVYLAKVTYFLPVAAGWALFSVFEWRYRSRRRYILAAMLLPILLLTASLGLTLTGHGNTAGHIGSGPLWDELRRTGAPLASALSLSGSPWSTALGLASVVAGLTVFLPCALWEVKTGWSASAEDGARIRRLLVFMGGAALAVAAVLDVRVAPQYAQRFRDVHEHVADDLWRHADYIEYAWRTTCLHAVRVAVLGLVILAVARLLRGSSRAWRVAAALLMASAFARSVASLWAADGPGFMAIPGSMGSTLAAIPVTGSVVLTDDCSHNPGAKAMRPLVNAWAPALRGHQFWASVFTYNDNFSAQDALERVQRIQWFFGRPVDAESHAWLCRVGITHVFAAKGRLLATSPPAETPVGVRLLARSPTHEAWAVDDCTVAAATRDRPPP